MYELLEETTPCPDCKKIGSLEYYLWGQSGYRVLQEQDGAFFCRECGKNFKYPLILEAYSKIFQVKIRHNSPTWTQFREWNITGANLTFYMEIEFYNQTELIVAYHLKIKGCYYCFGSCSFESNCEIIAIEGTKINQTILTDNIKEQIEKELDDSLVSRDEIWDCLWKEVARNYIK